MLIFNLKAIETVVGENYVIPFKQIEILEILNNNDKIGFLVAFNIWGELCFFIYMILFFIFNKFFNSKLESFIFYSYFFVLFLIYITVIFSLITISRLFYTYTYNIIHINHNFLVFYASIYFGVNIWIIFQELGEISTIFAKGKDVQKIYREITLMFSIIFMNGFSLYLAIYGKCDNLSLAMILPFLISNIIYLLCTILGEKTISQNQYIVNR